MIKVISCLSIIIDLNSILLIQAVVDERVGRDAES